MPKINQEEYEILKSLDDKWKWIARDEDRGLYAFTKKPVRKYDPSLYWDTEGGSVFELFDEKHLFQFIQWEDEKPYNIAELIEEYEDSKEYKDSLVIEYFLDKAKESVETEVKKDLEWLKEEISNVEYKIEDELYKDDTGFRMTVRLEGMIDVIQEIKELINQLDEPEQPKITLQDVTDKLWELPLNNRKLWLARLNDEFQEGYIVPLDLKTTDGEEQYLTYNGSYFASRRNKHLQQTFDTLEEIPEFYRDLAERVL